MKHKQYEEWILDKHMLSLEQKKELQDHLKICPECCKLSNNWQASEQLLKQAAFISPAPGFTQRWKMNLERKRQIEKTLHYRLALLAFLLLFFAGLLDYIITSGVFRQMLSGVITGIVQIIIAITHVFSIMSNLFKSLPAFVPFSIGFVLFGWYSAFLLAALFTFWNLKKRKMYPNENSTD